MSGELNLKGIIPATVLPFTSGGEVDEPSLRRYMSWLVEQGVVGVAVNADTGEGMHLEPAEKRRVIEVVAEEVGDRAAVVAGLIAPHNAAAVREARDAKAAGAGALLVFSLPAFRGRPLPLELPVRYFNEVAEVGLPLIIFQLKDELGGVLYEDAVIARLAEIEKVVAIKEASFDAARFVRTVRMLKALPRRITILTGNDHFIGESLLLGADGALIGFGNVATALQVEMQAAAMRGDHSRAMAIWEGLAPLEAVIFGPPMRDYRARLKEALVLLGVLESGVMRPPLVAVDEAERVRIREALKGAGLLVEAAGVRG